MPSLRPMRPYLLWLVPGQGIALLVARLAAPSAPELAPAVFLSLAFLAFAVAVSAAARPPLGEAGAGRAVLAVLDLRRNRGRYAFAFAAIAVAGAALALAFAGPAVSFAPTAGHAALAFALAFVAAWLILGEAACSQAAIREALLRGIERG